MATVKQATTGDINELADLFDSYRVFYKKNSDIEKARSFLFDRIKNKESVVFIAINDENRLTGFVQLYPLFSSTQMRPLWLLNDLFVDDNSRGKGISVALINKAKEHCEATSACGLMLETAKDNDIGNQLYPRTNFKLDSDHNFYFWDAE